MRSALLLIALAACEPPGYGKDHHTSDAAIDGHGSGSNIDAAIDGAAAMCDGMFRLTGHGSATSVWLTGTFNSWAGNPGAGAVPLALQADTSWTGTHPFAAGTYQYKYIVDGTSWIADPDNPNSIDDGFGGKNSLYTCQP
jgi:AMP-activated protein kinase-like protein